MAILSRSLPLGSLIPRVVAKDQDGASFDFASYCSSGYALVFFFPRAETPGCTAQACSLRDAFEDLQDQEVKVVGVSQDSVGRQKDFQRNRNLPFPLVSDPEKAVIAAFGVPSLFGLTKRQAYLFRDGVLVWKDSSAATHRQAADILAFLRDEKKG